MRLYERLAPVQTANCLNFARTEEHFLSAFRDGQQVGVKSTHILTKDLLWLNKKVTKEKKNKPIQC